MALGHFEEKSCQGTQFNTPGLRETIVDKIPCTRGIRTEAGIEPIDPLITIWEHEPVCHSTPTWATIELGLISIIRLRHNPLWKQGPELKPLSLKPKLWPCIVGSFNHESHLLLLWIGDFNNVFTYHAYSFNQSVVLDDHKACRGYAWPSNELMYAKWIPAW